MRVNLSPPVYSRIRHNPYHMNGHLTDMTELNITKT